MEMGATMSNDRYEEILDALAHEIWAVAQLAPGEGIVDGVDRIVALLRKVPHPAITHCDKCGCDWLDNGLNPIGCPYCELRQERRTAMTESVKSPERIWIEISGVGSPVTEYIRADKLEELAAENEALRAEVVEWKSCAEAELLPLPEGYDKHNPPRLYEGKMFHEGQMRAYARANTARAIAPLQAKIEALRAEVEVWKMSFEQAASGHATYAEQAEKLQAEVDVWKSRAEHDEALLRQALEVLEELQYVVSTAKKDDVSLYYRTIAALCKRLGEVTKTKGCSMSAAARKTFGDDTCAT